LATIGFEALYEHLDYTTLHPGVKFDLLEGPKVVARGTILRFS
jgi:hypothetical protein